MRERYKGHLPSPSVAAIIVIVAGVASAWTANLAGQAAQTPCPREPALFHPCALERARSFDPPRTREGVPDLQGFWRGPASGTENIEEHPATDDDNGGPSLIVDPVDGKVPYQAWATGLPAEHRRKYVEPNVPCFPSGVPRSLYVPTQIQFLQTPSHVLILFERAHTFRTIPTDPSPHIGEGIHLWQGDSRGRWEGDTLVVDVTNHNAKPWFDQAGNFYTDGAHMVERFTLVDPDTIHYVVTIDDPNLYTQPWTMAFPLRRNKEPGFRLLEEGCHEGERNTRPLIEAGMQIYPGMRGARPDK